MTRTKKRAPANTRTKKAESFQNAASDFDVPSHIHLRECDFPFWRSIVRARALYDWTDSDLEMAANLARCKADIERLQQEIDEEGDVIENKRGTKVMNPKHALLETLSRRAVALSRIVHVHAAATTGEARDKQAGATEQRNAGRILEERDDGLIAKPN